MAEAKLTELNHFGAKLSEAIENEKKVFDMPTIRVTYKQVQNKSVNQSEIFKQKDKNINSTRDLFEQ